MNPEHSNYYNASIGERPQYPSLRGEVIADVCIVGGGYTGLSTALHLAGRGYRVALLEARQLAWGASGRNGGQVGIGQRRSQTYLEKNLGRETAHTLWQMGLDAVSTVRRLILQQNIDCDVREGILHLAHKPACSTDLKVETEHLCQEYGYREVTYLNPAQVRNRIGSSAFCGGQLDRGSLHLHPLKYALGLARAAGNAGVLLYENSQVTDYTQGDNIRVKTAGGAVTAKELVLACNGYLGRLERRISPYIMPINNFLIATAPLGESLARELIRDKVAAQDTRFVINYWKVSADNRLIFGGGENYRKRLPANIAPRVSKRMLAVYPQLRQARIDYAWGGTLAITLNRLPHLGRTANNIWFAQGYSGHGISTGTFAGKLIADAISGKQERFDIMASLPVRRFPGGTLLRWPLMAMGMLYYSLKDRL